MLKRKKILSLMLSTVLVASLSACGSEPAADESSASKETSAVEESQADAETEEEVKEADPVTLVLAVYDTQLADRYETVEMESRFQELHPNVSIEVETFAGTEEYYKAMAIRATAEELPDVMFMKSTDMVDYADRLLELSDLESFDKNLYAADYAVDGKVLGLPTASTHTYMFYWESMFEEAGVTVPTTWDEFVDMSVKLDEYYKAQNPAWVTYCMGAKDIWPTYPFTEYLPLDITGNGFLYDTMATMDTPFAAGEDAYEGLKKVHEYFNLDIFGADPLGTGHDEIATLFKVQQAGLLAQGSGLISQMLSAELDMTGLKSFFIPMRDSVDEPLYTVSLVDNFLSIPSAGKNIDMAKAFVDFYFSEEFYTDISTLNVTASTVDGITIPLHESMLSAYDVVPDVQFVSQQGGGQDYKDIVNEVKFDWKETGAAFFTKDYDFEAKMAENNAAWTAARSSLGIK